MLCEVAVEGTLPSFDRLFTYSVPAGLTVAPGCRVRVPFGNGREERAGVCVRTFEGDPDGLRPVASALDASPVLDEGQLSLAGWMTDTLFCTWYTALRPMLPPGANVRDGFDRGETRLRVSGRFDPAAAQLSPSARELYAFLSENDGVALEEVVYQTGCTRAALRALVRRGAVDEFVPDPPPAEPVERRSLRSLRLTDEQQAAVDGLWKCLATGSDRTALLYGVTGAGKTAVFLYLLGALFPDDGAIVLVPEIALTPQTVRTFTSYFGDEVAVLHSGMTLADRRKSWERIRSGQARIVVGTRSAVFAPVRRLRLILMDEEQDGSYKSERAPRYHARSVARYRTAQAGGLLVLASATPSLETYALAEAGKLPRFELTRRYGGAALPPVDVLDMREPLRAGETTAFHPVLLRALTENLRRGEQSILLLNRRGYHTRLACMSCGEPLVCPHCSLALTYHAANGRLMCHYCGYSRPAPEVCPSCGGRLRPDGVGTQQAEEQLGQLLPDARILRMDADTTLARSSYDRDFGAFARGEYDILLGTQMVAKGLNFPNATLVGILAADNALYAQDFRSYERAFTLFTQVIGRCGRGEKPGRAFIQTLTPENAVFELAARQDYPEFFRQELRNRKLMSYPPYCAFLSAEVSAEAEPEARNAAYAFERLFGDRFKNLGMTVRLLAALDMELPKRNDRYIARMLIKYKNSRAFRDALRAVCADFAALPCGKRTYLSLDPNYSG